MQDNVVQYELDNNKSPVEQQKWILEQTREIGMGVTNLHGWLLKHNLQYDSDEAIDVVEQFIKYYSYSVFKASVKLGKKLGNAPAFDLIDNKDLYDNSSYFKIMVDEFYDGDYNSIKHMRNMSHLSFAPTGCQVKSNKIQTNKGNISIQQILNNNNIDHNTIEENGEIGWYNLTIPLNVRVDDKNYQDVYKIYYNGKVETRKITFEDGNVYEFTLNHPLYVNVNGEYIWKMVCDLVKGDDIVSF